VCVIEISFIVDSYSIYEKGSIATKKKSLDNKLLRFNSTVIGELCQLQQACYPRSKFSACKNNAAASLIFYQKLVEQTKLTKLLVL